MQDAVPRLHLLLGAHHIRPVTVMRFSLFCRDDPTDVPCSSRGLVQNGSILRELPLHRELEAVGAAESQVTFFFFFVVV